MAKKGKGNAQSSAITAVVSATKNLAAAQSSGNQTAIRNATKRFDRSCAKAEYRLGLDSALTQKK
jgi:hypothetical protein